MQRATWGMIFLGLCFLCVPVLAHVMGTNYIITLATRIVILALVALSLDILVGWAGLVSFGHAAFFGLGGYVVGIIAAQQSDCAPLFGVFDTQEALIIWPLAMLVCAALALVIGLLSLRARGVYFIMLTLAFAQMLYYFFVALKIYGGDDGLALSSRNLVAGFKVTDPRHYYFLCLGLLGAVWVLLSRIKHSRFGVVLHGAKASERRVAAIGVDVMPYHLFAFVLSAALAGLGGALWVNLGRFVAPDMLSWMRSGDFLVMVILGGSGTMLGPVVGAALYMVLETQLAACSEYWQIIFGPMVIAVALFLPQGVCAYKRGRAS